MSSWCEKDRSQGQSTSSCTYHHFNVSDWQPSWAYAYGEDQDQLAQLDFLIRALNHCLSMLKYI